MLDKMKKFVQYYMGPYAESISDIVLTHLARRLDEEGHTYCCFWAYVINNFEPNKLIQKNFLESPKVWQLFLDDRNLQKEFMRIKVNIEIERFDVETRLYTPEEVLVNDTIELSPVLRYTIGKYMTLSPEVYEHRRPEAIQQLREEPLLFPLLNNMTESLPISIEEVMQND
jgi:hypothetical protein